jgi:hypothetical protein
MGKLKPSIPSHSPIPNSACMCRPSLFGQTKAGGLQTPLQSPQGKLEPFKWPLQREGQVLAGCPSSMADDGSFDDATVASAGEQGSLWVDVVTGTFDQEGADQRVRVSRDRKPLPRSVDRAAIGG